MSKKNAKKAQRPEPTPIAIVGMASLFPKAQSLAEYWRNILDARDCISDVPDDHSWHPSDFHSTDRSVPDRTWATRGGYLDKVPFDPVEWGIPPMALEAVDTSQLLGLIVARDALLDAGLDPKADDWDRGRTGVILGVTGTQEMAVNAASRLRAPQWKKALSRHGIEGELADSIAEDIAKQFPAWTEQTFPGLLGNVVAGRITNRFDLGGANCVVDAACASSLAALDFAIGQLQSGKADVMLSGGVDTLNDIFMHMCFTRTPALSDKNDATPFDATSDGILLGEGLAMCVLKRLEDAERDGDRIYAVVRSVGASSDGRSKSIYAPDAGGQARAVRAAYEQLPFGLESVELIEAHGTGTKVGDVVEFKGLEAVFDSADVPKQSVAMGSVKSQIGHTKSTAGAAGLVKVALALHQRVLPPTAKVTNPNPKLDMKNSGLFLNTTARPWVRSDDHPRRAGLNSFGFGGSNFHVVVEEHGEPSEAKTMGQAKSELFLYGASTLSALAKQLVANDEPTVAHASRQVLSDWEPGDYVVSFTSDSLDDYRYKVEVARKLVDGGKPGSSDGVRFAVPTDADRKVGVLFPGQGSQYVDMGASLAVRHAPMRIVLDRAQSAMKRADRGSLARYIYPPSSFDDATADAQQAELTRTEWAQPAIGAVSAGMWAVLKSFGIQASAMAGHSYGELVALHAAGVLDEASLWTASRVRGEAMADNGTDRGTMAAVSGRLADIEKAIDGLDVVLANRNHPNQGVISGSKKAIANAIEVLKSKKLTAREIPVSAAFHSPLVADAAAPFSKAIGKLAFSKGKMPVYANATGKPYPAAKKGQRELLAKQITSPVRFVELVEAMYKAGIRTFVECGPKGVVSALARKCLRDKADVAVLSVDGKANKVDGDVQLKLLLAELAARGVPVDVTPLLEAELPAAPMKAGSKATTWIAGANHLTEKTKNPPLPTLSASWEPGARGQGPAISAGAPTSNPGAPSSPIQSTPRPAQPTGPGPRILAPQTTAPRPGSNPLTPKSTAMDPKTLADLLETTRASLTAFQRAQERTAQVHQEFLAAHAKATDSFKELFQTHARLVELAAGQGVALPSQPVSEPVVPATPAVPTAAASSTAPAPDPWPLATGSAASASTPAPDPFLPKHGAPTAGITSRGSSSDLVFGQKSSSSALPPLLDAGMSKSASSFGPPPSASKGSAPTADVTALMMASIAEKTGYPHDMLELSMDLEADLGIDSIKRVEILAAVQEQVPGMPELDNDEMSALRSVSDVVDYLKGKMGSVPSNGGGSGAPIPVMTADMAAPAPTGKADVTALMMASIAEKTGYPRDMLELSMDLEADLGIDSIKRVEILAAVQEQVPGMPELDNDEMSALRSVSDVVDYLKSKLAGGTPAPFDGGPAAQTAGLTTETVAAPTVARRRVVVVRAPDGTPVTPKGTLVITRDPAGKAAEVASALQAKGVEAMVIDPDWSKPESLASSMPNDPWGLLHLAAVGADDASVEARVRGAFHLAHAAGPLPFFATVSGQGGRFGLSAPLRGHALEGALAGLAKTAGVEWADSRAVAYDVDPKADWAERLANEVLLDRGVPEVGLASEAVTLGVRQQPADEGSSPLGKGDLVVVSGGARGVTAAVVIELAAQVRATFLLLGRSEVPDADPEWALGKVENELMGAAVGHLAKDGAKPKPAEARRLVGRILASREVRDTLSRIAMAGGKATYRSVDVRDAKAVGAVVSDLVSAEGPVRAVVHGAGVIRDKAIVDKTPEQFDAVWGTKVEGLDNLLDAVDIGELRFAAMFSSVAGRYGNNGQCDYSMANEAITRRARDLAAQGVRARSFDWGPWAGGMVDAALARHFEASGTPLIPLDAGARAFVADLCDPGSHVEVVIGGPDVPDAADAPIAGQRTIHLSGERFLTEHRLDGKPVLPVVMVLEWLHDAAGSVFPGLAVRGVRDLSVLKGVTVAEPTDLQLTWTEVDGPASAVHTLRFELTGAPGPFGPTVHYSGSVDLVSQRSAPTPFPGSNGLGKGNYPHEIAAAYRQFLFHGPDLRGISAIDGMSDEGIVGRIRTSRPSSLGVSGEAWHTDPVALDSVLQMMVLWVREQTGSAALPSAVGEYRQYAPLTGELAVHLEMNPARTTHGSFNATLVDGDGIVVATLTDGQYTANPAMNVYFKAPEARA